GGQRELYRTARPICGDPASSHRRTRGILAVRAAAGHDRIRLRTFRARITLMRVLFTSTPGWGHIHPMVPLARAFLDRDDAVWWVTAADACARLQREGFQTTAAGLSERDGMSELFRQFPEIEALAPQPRPEFMFPRLFGTVRA